MVKWRRVASAKLSRSKKAVVLSFFYSGRRLVLNVEELLDLISGESYEVGVSENVE